MNNLMRKIMDNNVPKFSKAVVDGTVKDVFETLPVYLDKVLHSSIRSLNKNVKLKYNGYSYVDPEEDFHSNYLNTSSKNPFDLAHSDVYPLKFHFEYNGVPFEKVILLPYGRKGNIMMMSGTKYVVVPVLSDTVISPEAHQVFVRLLKDKLTFRNNSFNVIYNGEQTNGLLIWVEIMKNTAKSGDLGKPLASIGLYLLGKYGFKGVIEKYFKKELKGLMNRDLRPDDVIIQMEDSEELRKTHNVFESTKIRPPEVKTPGQYIGHDVKIFINKDIPETSFIKNFIYGLIHSLDTLPAEAPEIMEYIKTGNVEDETFKWKMILGTIAYKGSFSTIRISADIKEHFNSVEYYVDSIIKDQLKEISIYVDDFFDLLYYILKKYSEWTLSAKYYNSDIRNRYIDIKYYICYEIIIGFNKVILSLNKRMQKAQDQEKTIRENEIFKIFQEDFKKNAIYSLVKSSIPHLNIIGADSTTDLMYPKCTSCLEDQSRGDGVKRSSTPRFPEAARFIHGSDVLLGSILYLGKLVPSGRFKSNVYMNYNINTGRIHIPKDMEKIIEAIDTKLQGKRESVNSNILISNEDQQVEK